jgi:hypothetical protein
MDRPVCRSGGLTYEESAFRTQAPSLAKKQLTAEFESYWPTRQSLDALNRSENDKRFADQFAEFGIKFDTWRTPRLLDSLYSLKSKSMVGYAYKTFPTGLVQIAHRLFDSRKEFFVTYLRAMNFYGLRDVAKAADRAGKLNRRVEEVRASKGERHYRFPAHDVALVHLLFPELAHLIHG